MNASLSLDRDRIRIADALLIYLERTQATRRIFPDGRVPRSFGALPLAIGGAATPTAEINPESRVPRDVVIAPAMPGEAVWLGFQAVDRNAGTTIRVRMDGQRHIDAMTGGPWTDGFLHDPGSFLQCPPDSRLVGRRVPGGRRLFETATRAPLTIFVWTPSPIGEVSIRFCSPEQFLRISGRNVERLDPAAAYTGRRLP